MKKTLFITSLSLLLFSGIKAQDSISDVFNSADYDFKAIKLHHLKKMQSIDVRVMYAKLGTAFEFNYGYLMTDEAQFHIGAYYEFGKIGYTTYDYKNAKIGVAYSLFKVGQRLFISPDLSLLAGFIKGKSSDFETTDSYFNYGVSLGLNTELYITNKLCFLIVADQQYNFKDQFGKYHYNVGAGLRLYVK